MTVVDTPHRNEDLVIAFGDDGVVHVFEDRAAAIREYEGIDVESGIVDFYDMRGVRLHADFLKPNRRGTLFGLFPWVVSGVYQLVQDPEPDPRQLAIELAEAVALEPNPWFESLSALGRHFAALHV